MSDIVTPLEWGRMFLGEQPVMFYVEIVVRTFIIYAYTFLLLRIFGRRTKSQLSILDVLVIVALGSAVGDSTFYPEVPLFHCLLVVTLIVLFNKLIVEGTQVSAKLRKLVEGEPAIVVRDGVIQTRELSDTSVGRRALLELLRLKGVSNLGQLDMVVLEPSCQISIYPKDEPIRGLSILPTDDGESDAAKADDDEQIFCCDACGLERDDDGSCCKTDTCGHTDTVRATCPEYSL